MSFNQKLNTVATNAANRAASQMASELLKRVVEEANATGVVSTSSNDKFQFTSQMLNGRTVTSLARDRYMDVGDPIVYLGGVTGGRVFG